MRNLLTRSWCLEYDAELDGMSDGSSTWDTEAIKRWWCGLERRCNGAHQCSEGRGSDREKWVSKRKVLQERLPTLANLPHQEPPHPKFPRWELLLSSPFQSLLTLSLNIWVQLKQASQGQDLFRNPLREPSFLPRQVIFAEFILNSMTLDFIVFIFLLLYLSLLMCVYDGKGLKLFNFLFGSPHKGSIFLGFLLSLCNSVVQL